MESQDSFQVISGYRSPASNAKLRKAGGGVAKRSLHMRGKAIDIRLPGVELKHLRQAALNLKSTNPVNTGFVTRYGGLQNYQKRGRPVST